MKEKLEHENLVLVSIDKQNPHWITNHELLIDGKMFDVHSTEEIDGQIIVSGLFDEKETAIDIKLTALDQHSSNDHEKQILQTFFQTILFCNHLDSFTPEIAEWNLSQKFNLYIQAEHLPFSPGNFTPPPEV